MRLGQRQLPSRLVDKGFPAQIGADVLDLDTDLTHLAAELVIYQIGSCVVEDVTFARGVGGLGDRLEGRFEVLPDLRRKLFGLLTRALVLLLARRVLRVVEVEASGRGGVAGSPALVHGGRETKLHVVLVVLLDRLADLVLIGRALLLFGGGFQLGLDRLLDQGAAGADLDQLDGRSRTEPDMADRRADEAVQLEKELAEQMHDAERRQGDVLDLLGRIEGQEGVVVILCEPEQRGSQRRLVNLRGVEQTFELGVTLLVHQGEQHAGDRRLVHDPAHDVGLQRLEVEARLPEAEAVAPGVLLAVGLVDFAVQTIDQKILVDVVAPVLVLRAPARVLQTLPHLGEQEAAAGREQHRTARLADLDRALHHLVVGIERDFAFAFEQTNEGGELRLLLGLAPDGDPAQPPLGFPADKWLIDAEQFARIRQNGKVVGQVGQSFIRHHRRTSYEPDGLQLARAIGAGRSVGLTNCGLAFTDDCSGRSSLGRIMPIFRRFGKKSIHFLASREADGYCR